MSIKEYVGSIVLEVDSQKSRSPTSMFRSTPDESWSRP